MAITSPISNPFRWTYRSHQLLWYVLLTSEVWGPFAHLTFFFPLLFFSHSCVPDRDCQWSHQAHLRHTDISTIAGLEIFEPHRSTFYREKERHREACTAQGSSPLTLKYLGHNVHYWVKHVVWFIHKGTASMPTSFVKGRQRTSHPDVTLCLCLSRFSPSAYVYPQYMLSIWYPPCMPISAFWFMPCLCYN